MLKRNAFKNTSEKDLRFTAKWFKVLRWLTPLMFLIVGFGVAPRIIEDIHPVFLMAVVGISVWDYFMFDRIYKNARDELKDRFGVRL